jgi:putative transcriptional regulator
MYVGESNLKKMGIHFTHFKIQRFLEKKMDDGSSSPLKGKFLTAMPLLLDQNFYQTVTCICEYTSAGAVGIVVNRIHPALSGKDIFEELNMKYTAVAETIPIHIGGPVHNHEIFILHGPPFDWEGCFLVTPTLAMSNTRDILEAVAMGVGPKSFLIALGCAGWGPGQLESEIKQNSWLTSAIFEEVIFNMPIENRWAAVMKKMGIDPALLLDTAGHA